MYPSGYHRCLPRFDSQVVELHLHISHARQLSALCHIVNSTKLATVSQNWVQSPWPIKNKNRVVVGTGQMTTSDTISTRPSMKIQMGLSIVHISLTPWKRSLIWFVHKGGPYVPFSSSSPSCAPPLCVCHLGSSHNRMRAVVRGGGAHH